MHEPCSYLLKYVKFGVKGEVSVDILDQKTFLKFMFGQLYGERSLDVLEISE